MSHIHTIPVDPSFTPDEAWHEIRLYGRRITYTEDGNWVNRECNNDCDGIEDTSQ